MGKKDKDSVYKVVEVVGTSPKSWAEAGRKAVETAAGSLRDLRIAEVVKMDMAIEKGSDGGQKDCGEHSRGSVRECQSILLRHS